MTITLLGAQTAAAQRAFFAGAGLAGRGTVPGGLGSRFRFGALYLEGGWSGRPTSRWGWQLSASATLGSTTEETPDCTVAGPCPSSTLVPGALVDLAGSAVLRPTRDRRQQPLRRGRQQPTSNAATDDRPARRADVPNWRRT